MQPLYKKWPAGALLIVSLLVPLYAYANVTGISFGGTVLQAVPCISPVGAAYYITIASAGATPAFAFIWTIATLGPPAVHFGQQILGVADTAFGCSVGHVPLAGLRIQFDNVSI